MRKARPNRVTRSYTQRIDAPPVTVIPLLCPTREAEWLHGWDPVVVYSESGVAEPDCVFLTRAHGHDAVWIITRHEPARGLVEMLKVTPEITVCKLTIEVRAEGEGSAVTVTYSHTSLGPRGDAFVAAFDEPTYVAFMEDWERRMNHFLRHGVALREER